MIGNIRPDGSFVKSYKTKTSVRLGEGGITTNRIVPEAFERGVETLKSYKQMMVRHNVQKIYAYGTAALRSAENSEDFIDEVYDATGISIKIISGEEEAELICHGVWEALSIGNTPALIIDIGGGSNEFILADDEKIIYKGSFNIGVARLMEQFKPSDPIKPEEISIIEGFLREELQSLFEALKPFKTDTIIGSSGSFDTFAEMIAYRFYSLETLKGRTEYNIDLHDFHQIHTQLLISTFEERLHTKGIIRMRADMIVLASVFVNFMIRELEVKNLRISTYALKEGALAKIIYQMGYRS